MSRRAACCWGCYTSQYKSVEVVEVCQRFDALYAVVNHDYRDQNGVTSANIFGLANYWVNRFISLEGKRKGYEKKRVTPYMPCLVYHMPFLSGLHLGLKKFSGQGMEKANEIAKSIHHQHSNKIDACANILKGSMRQLQLKHMQRESREYSKRKEGGKSS